MKQLVYMYNNRLVTDSIYVADESAKLHKNVLRDIKNLKVSDDFKRLNFEPINYKDGRGRNQTKYLITKQGFTFLVMGYVGERFAKFKEEYILEFDRMSSVLNEAEPVTMISLMQKIKEIEERLEQQITLNSRQQRILQQAITSRVHSLETNKVTRRLIFRQLHGDIRDRWEVSSYKDVLQRNLKEALARIAEWVPIRELES